MCRGDLETGIRHIGIDKRTNSNCSRITSKPEVISSSVGLVSRNAPAWRNRLAALSSGFLPPCQPTGNLSARCATGLLPNRPGCGAYHLAVRRRAKRPLRSELRPPWSGYVDRVTGAADFGLAAVDIPHCGSELKEILKRLPVMGASQIEMSASPRLDRLVFREKTNVL